VKDTDIPMNLTDKSELLGKSRQMQALFLKIKKVARVDAPVMINGESGTGKELAAKAIHDSSSFSSGPFIAVNCGAIVTDLVQSELFGYEKGAFTGASRQKVGYIEAAKGGTLFLDEIGDLPLCQQSNLLRFLQEKTIQRVGGTESIHVDVRVTAATHVDLEMAISCGEFREDLYYRLNVLQLNLVPLREREGDVELLAHYFFQKFSHEKKPIVKGFSDDCIKKMGFCPWPGNVREMMNRIRRSMVMCDKEFITAFDLGIGKPLVKYELNSLKKVKDDAEHEAVRLELIKTKNNISLAAKNLAISRVTLYRLITKYEINAHNLYTADMSYMSEMSELTELVV
jgi:transcriptional regulator with PAS, ATPase and Fis domain